MHPRLFQFGQIVIATYGVVLACGILFAFLVAAGNARQIGLAADKLARMCLLGIATGVVAMRLIALCTLWPRYGVRALLLSFDSGFGGAPRFGVVLSAVVLAAAASLVYALRESLPVLRAADAIAPALALGAAAASIACLESGCGYGLPTQAPWAIVFTSPYLAPDVPRGVPLHPVQAYAALASFAIFVALMLLLRSSHRDGEVMGAWLFLAGLSGSLLLLLRGGGVGQHALAPVHTLVHAPVLNLEQSVDMVMVTLGGLLWLRRSPRGVDAHAG